MPKIIKSEPRENLKERFFFEIDFFLKNQNTKTRDIYLRLSKVKNISCLRSGI